jgi:hypothetical protein
MHDTFELLRTWQRYFGFLAIPDATLRCDLDLRPAIGLWHISPVANYTVELLARDSHGTSSEKGHTKLGMIETIQYGLYKMRGRADK